MLRTCAFCAFAFVAALAATPVHAQPEGPQADPAVEETVGEPAAPAEMSEEEIAAAIAAFDASLTRKTGKITLPLANVTLTVPDSFYFLNPADSEKVLTEGWGNPPDSSIAGMLFPADMSPLGEDSWGVVLRYEATGYVSDEDASTIDYDMLIDAMRESTEAENAMRKAQGYEAIEVIGWAATPRYDAGSHKLYWAKELLFEGQAEHTLNYDMRVLGRRGVLSLNFVATVGQLAEIERASPAVLAIPEFDAGSRYEDFNASVDAKADFGVAGLIGGTAAAAVLAKNGGLLAAALMFLKKGWFLIFAAIAGIGAAVRRLFNGKSKAAEKADQSASTAFFDAPAVPDNMAPDAASQSPPPSS